MRAWTSALTLLVGSVAGEVARGREFTELHADHVLVHRDGNELATIVDVEGQADERRQDGRATRPGLDRTCAVASILSHFGLLQEMEVHERTLPNGTSHCVLA